MKKVPFLALPFVVLLAGCQTMQTSGQRQSAARQQAAFRVTEERVQRLQARVESAESENARLSRELQQVRQNLSAQNRRVTELDANVKRLQTQQAQQNQKLIAQVESLIKKAFSGSASSHSSAARGPGREHIVEAGHTLSAIAKAYGTSVEAIKKANHLKSDNIYVGQKLFIPQ